MHKTEGALQVQCARLTTHFKYSRSTTLASHNLTISRALPNEVWRACQHIKSPEHHHLHFARPTTLWPVYPAVSKSLLTQRSSERVDIRDMTKIPSFGGQIVLPEVTRVTMRVNGCRLFKGSALKRGRGFIPRATSPEKHSETR